MKLLMETLVTINENYITETKVIVNIKVAIKLNSSLGLQVSAY